MHVGHLIQEVLPHFTSENSNLLETHPFFLLQTNYQLAITQDLTNEFYQVVGDALMYYIGNPSKKILLVKKVLSSFYGNL